MTHITDIVHVMPTQTPTQTQLNIRIPTTLRKSFAELARRRYTSISALAREAIARLLDNDPKGEPPGDSEPPEQVKEAARKVPAVSIPAVTEPHRSTPSVTWS